MTITETTVFNRADARVSVRLTPYQGFSDTITVEAQNPIAAIREIRRRLWIWLLVHPHVR